MAHITKDKGDLAVAKAIAHLMEHDIRVCMPLSEHLPFDFVAVMPDMTTLKRVQVKYRTKEKTGAMKIFFRSNYYDSKRIYSVKVNLDEIDTYAVYCPDTDLMYYINTDEFSHDMIALSLRIDPVKNGQQKGIWNANDYVNPKRLAIVQPAMRMVQKESSYQHAVTTTQVIQDLMVTGWYVCTPYLVTDMPFDLIAVSPDMMRLIRIRVGYGIADTTPYADAYAIYNPADKSVHYVSTAQVQPTDRCVGLDTHIAAMNSKLEVAIVA